MDSHSLQQYNRPLLHDDAKALNARCEVHESRYGPSEKLYFIRIQNKLSSFNRSTETFLAISGLISGGFESFTGDSLINLRKKGNKMPWNHVMNSSSDKTTSFKILCYAIRIIFSIFLF